jgi:hypothetical protein
LSGAEPGLAICFQPEMCANCHSGKSLLPRERIARKRGRP